MSSKKNRRPDQEFYRPPKNNRTNTNSDPNERSHERTFYNSNHKKKNFKSDNKRETQNSSTAPKELKSHNYSYEGDYGRRYYQGDYSYSGYDTYSPRYSKYHDDNGEFENFRDSSRKYRSGQDIYFDDDYYYNNYNDYRQQFKTDYGNFSKSQSTKEKPRQKQQTTAPYKKGETNKQQYKVEEKPKVGLNDKKENIVFQKKSSTLNTEEVSPTQNNSRHRLNSHNRDFNDSRLFNPYKNELDNNVSSKSTCAKPSGPNSIAITKEKLLTDEDDSHIHGGLIHLPEHVDIKTSSTATSQFLSADSVTEPCTKSSAENKPTVMIRPTFSHLVTSSSISYPPIPVVHGLQTISGFIPVQSTYISPINLIRNTGGVGIGHAATMPPPPQNADYSAHIIQPVRYPAAQIQIHTPDETTINFSIPNLNSKVPLVSQSVNNIRTLEAQLEGYIRSKCDIASVDWWKTVNQIRSDLMELYRNVIIYDLDYCNQAGIEQNLWKSVFYAIMEMIRTFISNPENAALIQNKKDDPTKIKQDIVSNGQAIIRNGEDYFINLYKEISQLSNVDLQAIFDSRRPPPETGSRTRKLVYLSAQKLLLFLGDLARYSEIINNTSDYSKARIWYLKAQLLVPKNGRPYNQLAVISIYSNRHLDALYYYTRTLAASNPFPTASQSLSFLFEEARRKADEILKKHQESLKRKKKKQNSANENRRKGCIETWIHPDGTKEKKVTDDDDTDILATFDGTEEGRLKSEKQIKEDYLSMPLIELNKLFTLSFLNSHGKLFGKINMENFPEVGSTMLQEFWALLSHQPCPLNSFRLCHMLIINMYIMDRVSQQLSVITNLALRSLHQDHASRMTLDFFALLCQRAIEIFNEWSEDVVGITGPLQLPYDLTLLLPPICLWTDWMVTHPEYWSPPPSHRDPLLLPIINDFSLIAELCTIVGRLVERDMPRFNRPKYRIINDTKEAEKSINNLKTFALFEENLISGFLPMLDQIPKIYLLEDEKWSKEQTEDWIHLEKISLFGDFLCGINPPLLDFDVKTSTYISTVIKEGSERRQDEVVKLAEDSEEDIKDIEEDLDLKLKMQIDEINSTHCASEVLNQPISWADITEQAEEEERNHQKKIAQLKIKRANMKIKEEKNKRYEMWRQSLLDHEIAQRFVELEIRPLFLVLDTNCYIDYLNDIDMLINHKRFIVVVPLIVINELENLSKTVQMKDDVDIQARAKKSLKYLEDRFENGDPNVKAITSRGSFLETIAYRTEALTWAEGETNDDIILNCCQYLCKDKASEFMPREKDKPITLHREVVLLTGDRNLRIKALSRHIPVKPLRKFMEWVDIRRKSK